MPRTDKSKLRQLRAPATTGADLKGRIIQVQTTLVACPRNHLYRTFERSWNITAFGQRYEFHDVAHEFYFNTGFVMFDGDFLNEAAQYLCCFGSGLRIG
jgi:hypothetical protein